MSDSITQETCTGCGKRNVVHLGDMSDVTAPDVFSFKCWSCGLTQFLPEVDWYEKERLKEESDDGYGYTVDGRPRESDELVLLRERVRWLEEGLKAVAASAVLEPVVCSGRTCFGNPYDIRAIAEHYLKGPQ